MFKKKLHICYRNVLYFIINLGYNLISNFFIIIVFINYVLGGNCLWEYYLKSSYEFNIRVKLSSHDYNTA